MVSEIKLNDGSKALVDAVSLPLLKKYRNWTNKNGHAVAFSFARGGDVTMQEIIGRAGRDKKVRHINGNTLDNRLDNLSISPL